MLRTDIPMYSVSSVKSSLDQSQEELCHVDAKIKEEGRLDCATSTIHKAMLMSVQDMPSPRGVKPL